MANKAMLAARSIRSMMPDVGTVVGRSKWFAGLPTSLRQSLLAAGVIKIFPRGSWIYVQGDPPRGMWAIVEGEVSFAKVGPGGNEVVIHVAGPGFWFGMLGALTGIPLGIAITAATEASLLHIPRKVVEAIVEAEPRHVLRLLQLPASRAVELLELVEQITRPSPRARVASRLLTFQRTTAEHTDDGWLPLRVSQAQLAAMTALSRQSVSRVLGELAQLDAIAVGFRQITIVDADRLQQIANEVE